MYLIFVRDFSSENKVRQKDTSRMREPIVELFCHYLPDEETSTSTPSGGSQKNISNCLFQKAIARQGYSFSSNCWYSRLVTVCFGSNLVTESVMKTIAAVQPPVPMITKHSDVFFVLVLCKIFRNQT